MKRLIFISIGFFLLGCDQWTHQNPFQFSGTLEVTEYSLGAKAGGLLEMITVEEGEEIKKEQVIATLDRYEQAKKDYERTQKLFRQGGATKQDLEYAALALRDQQIISPIDGVVLVKVHEKGEIVSGGGSVAVIGDQKNLWVKIFVPESIINQLQLNEKALIYIDGLKQPYEGHVSFISREAEFTPRNAQTKEERILRTFAVKVKIDNPSSYLRPGVNADVTFKSTNSY